MWKFLNKTYLTIAEGLSNCEVSLGQYLWFCLRRGHYPYMNNAYAVTTPCNLNQTPMILLKLLYLKPETSMR